MSKFLCIVCIFLTLVACQDKSPKSKQEAPAVVKTMVVGANIIDIERIFPGYVIANRRVDLSFLVPGQIIEFPVKAGEIVEKGQLLVRLDPKDYQNKYNGEKAKLYRHERQHARMKQLLKSGTIAVADYEQAEATYEVSKANAAKAKKALDDTELRATFDGVIANTHVENYQSVQAKEKILSLQNVDSVDIVIVIPEQDVIRVQKPQRKIARGEKVDGYVLFDALPDNRFEATLKEYATEADPITQTYEITLNMKVPEGRKILPGMTASYVTQDPSASKDDVIFIPSHSIAIDELGQKYVWRVDAIAMKVKKQPVATGMLTGGQIQVVSGLSPGDRIVVAGVSQLVEGMPIKIMETRAGN